MRVFCIAVAAGVALMFSSPAPQAQDWPTRPIKVVTPLAAGGAAVARADPDGTTLLLGTAAALNVAPVLAKNFPADLVAGLTPLTLAVELPMCLVANKSLPVSNITE